MAYAVNTAVSHVEAPPIAEAQKWVKPGPRNRDLLNLCQAVPSYPPADALQDEVARAAHEPDTSLYTAIRGLPALREALAHHMAQDYRGTISAEDVAITAGCNQAFAAAVMAVAKAGDNIVVPLPYYFNHAMWLGMLGIEARHVSAFSRDGAWPSAQDAGAVIDGKTRAILLCTPNNPTGAIYPPQVISAFYELAQARGIALIMDETYKDFRPDPAPPHDLFQRPDWRETFVQLYSFSKIFAMTGYRTGSIIAGPAFMAEADKILDTMTICPPHISQRAALFGLGHLDTWKNGKKAMMLARTETLRAALKRPGLTYELVSSGAYFAYLRHPFRGEASKAVAMRLAAEHDLLCLPGSMFGPNQEDYLRLAFANVDQSLMEAVAERLAESQ